MADKTIVDVQDTPTATVTTYSDGSTDITYKNQPIVDPECANYTNVDIDAGKICQYNVGVPGKVDYFEFRYIPTERWTGKVQSWGELKANMDRVVALNPKFPESARHNVFYQNPSWHPILNNVTTPDGKFRSPDGLTLSYHVEKGEYGVVGYPDSYFPESIGPTTTTANTKTYIVDPKTGVSYEIPPGANGDTPITPDGRTLNQLVYPSGAPDMGSLGFDTPIPGTTGAPVSGPIAQPAGTTTGGFGGGTGSATATNPTTGYVRPLIDIKQLTAVDQALNATPPQPSSNNGMWLIVALGAAIAALFLF